jgi:hypothetical protein
LIHLTTHQLSSYLDRELPESSQELVRRHLDGCSECARRFAAFGEQEAILDRVLVHDPGEEFFEGFADQVLGASPVAKRRVAEKPLPERPVPKEPELLSPRSRQPAVPWFAAAILCLIVGAVGYVLPRPASTPLGSMPAAPHETAPAAAAPPVQRRPPSPPAPHPVAAAQEPVIAAQEPVLAAPTPVVAAPAPILVAPPPVPAAPPPRARDPLPPAESIVPVRRLITTTEVSAPSRQSSTLPSAPSPIKQPPTQPLDEFAAAPESARPIVAAARHAAQAAALDSSAANLDATGNAWEQAVPALSGAEQTLARRELAEARYKAWVAAPDPYRAAAATASLRTFLVLSPPGPSRDLAKEWLKRINGG